MWNKQQLFTALGAPEVRLLGPVPARTAWTDAQRAALRAQAEIYLNTPIPALPYSLFKLFWRTGDRAAYQAPYFERRGRLMAFALLQWLEPDTGPWKTALEDTIWAICEEAYWCVPAHFMGPGDTPLSFAEYEGQLDLFSCETAFALAEALALCQDGLDEAVVERAQGEVERRVFAPFLSGRFYRFEAMSNNWCAVCGGAIGGAALHLVRDRARLTALLHRCLSCLDVYLASFGGDGVCVEGVGYWTYGFGFFTCFADLLQTRTAGALDLLSDPKAAAIARCQQHYYLTGGHTVSFADGSPESGFRMGLSCYLQKRFPDAALPAAEVADGVLRDPCYRFCLSLRDFLWYDESARFGLPARRTVWLPDAQWFLSGGERLILAAKAGHNGESHNHNDCGAFILCKDGVPAVCDLGAGQYDAAYFGPERYSVFVNASRSHSVPLPAGKEQAAGICHAARDVLVEQGAVDRFAMELAACYDCPGLVSLRREFRHDKEAGVLTLTDAFTFDSPQGITEAFVSRGPISLAEGAARFGALSLRFDAARLEASVWEERWPTHEDGHLETAYLLRLTAKAPAARQTYTFTLA